MYAESTSKFATLFIILWSCFVINLENNILVQLGLQSSLLYSTLAALAITYLAIEIHPKILFFLCILILGANMNNPQTLLLNMEQDLALTIALSLSIMPWLNQMVEY